MKLKADRFAYLLRPSGEKGFGTIVAFVPFAPMTTFVCASPPQVRKDTSVYTSKLNERRK